MAQRGGDPLLGPGQGRHHRAGAPARRGAPVSNRLRAATLRTRRLVLEPLRAEHAVELEPLLADPAIYRFIGGGPEAPDELAARVRRQAAGVSPDGTEVWLNWVMRAASPPDQPATVGAADPLVGTFQGTLAGSQAELAWVVGTAHQGQGFASEAALGVAAWLERQGVTTLIAHIHPDHAASQGVARRLGLAPTEARQDGEVRWVSTPK